MRERVVRVSASCQHPDDLRKSRVRFPFEAPPVGRADTEKPRGSMKERTAFDVGMLAGVLLCVAADAGHWLITPMSHSNASAFQHNAVVVQALVSLGVALFLILRRRPGHSPNSAS